MQKLNRTCSECGKSLAGRPAGTMTCDAKCRARKTRRIAREGREAKSRAVEARYPEHHREAMEATVAKARDVAADVMAEELRPIVREAMTDAVLSSVRDLISLTPRAIQRLNEDMDSQDEQIRQRAYTLLLRYTMGNPTVAPPPADLAPAPMQVHFHMPRPDTTDTGEVIEAAAVEARTCMECKQDRTEFVAGSDRCVECHDALQLRVAGMFGP